MHASAARYSASLVLVRAGALIVALLIGVWLWSVTGRDPAVEPVDASTLAGSDRDVPLAGGELSGLSRDGESRQQRQAVVQQDPPLPKSLPDSFDELVKANLQPAPFQLQAAARQLAEAQHRSFQGKFREANPESLAAALSWQDDAYMMRLTELAVEALEQGRGLLVVEGVMPDAAAGRQHFYMVPALEVRFGRQIGVLVDLDAPDEQLAASDAACRELRFELAGQKVQAFNARPEADRRAVVERYLRAKRDQVGIDWSWFGLEPGEQAYVTVDEVAALLTLVIR